MVKLKGKQTLHWQSEAVNHGDYTDLGHYIIDLGVIDQTEFAKGAAAANRKLDVLKTKSCTAIAKKNKKGEVIIGRNQDEEVSNYPVLISHLTGGKYQAVSFFYSHKQDYTYAQFQEGLELPEHFRGMMASISTDSFNEKGLYVQTNMRTNVGIATTGTNPGAERVPMIGLASRIAQNAATLQEARDYIDTLDVYTMGGNRNATWDYAYLIGDATGEYGIIEFAANKVYFTPYPNGHCNAFVSPALAATEPYGAGYGRLYIGLQAMVGAETAEDMMEAIHKADWYHSVQDFEYSYKDKNGCVHFVDKDGNPSIDWRSEFSMTLAIDDDDNVVPEDCSLMDYLDAGCYLLSGKNLAQLITGRKNPKVSSEAQEVIDAVNAIPETLHDITATAYPEFQQALDEMTLETMQRYHKNCTTRWLLNDENFDTVKDSIRKLFERGNAFDLLKKFMAGDKQPLRDQGDVFTTGMNFGVNCAKKHLIARFLEDEEAVYEYKW